MAYAERRERKPRDTFVSALAWAGNDASFAVCVG
jgi:hypothetical protein